MIRHTKRFHRSFTSAQALLCILINITTFYTSVRLRDTTIVDK